MPISPDDVIEVYRSVLGRMPESEKVIESQAERFESVEAFRRAALQSVEFKTKLIPDGKFYSPLFAPWKGFGDFVDYYRVARSKTLVSPDRCHVLYQLALQALGLKGDFWECGVYKGGTAAMLAEILARKAPNSGRRLNLFDTFEGMPETDPSRDFHKRGDFADTSIDAVRSVVGHSELVVYHQGFIPVTFSGLESAVIAFAHVDVDVYKSVIDCCKFVYPRLSTGGFIIFDDYGFPSCPGARAAVDEYFDGTGVVPLVLPTGQAIVFKSF